MKRVVALLALATGLATTAHAGPKMDPQLRDKLKEHFGAVKFAVTVEEGMPAMPVGGSIFPDYFAVKCENGGLLTKGGTLSNLGKKASQTLEKGEILTVEVVRITDSGLNLSLKTVRQLYAGMKDVGKNKASIQSQYDQFGTEIQFKFDAQYVTSMSDANLTFITDAVQTHVRLFANDREARSFSRGEPQGQTVQPPPAPATAQSVNQ